MATKLARAEDVESSADGQTLVERIISALPGAADEATIPPAFVIPGVSPEFPPALLAAAAALRQKIGLAEKAQEGAQSLTAHVEDLRKRADALRNELKASTGAAAAARAAAAMGLANVKTTADAASDGKRAELEKLAREIAATENACEAVPALFEQVREELDGAYKLFHREFKEAGAPLANWADRAEEQLNEALSSVRIFRSALHPAAGTATNARLEAAAVGHPFALFPRFAEFERLHSASLAFDRALKPRDPPPELRVEREIRVVDGRQDPKWQQRQDGGLREETVAGSDER